MSMAADLLKECHRIMVTGIPIEASPSEIHAALQSHPAGGTAGSQHLLNTLALPNAAQRCVVCFADYRTKEACLQCTRAPLQIRGSHCFVSFLGSVQRGSHTSARRRATTAADQRRASAKEKEEEEEHEGYDDKVKEKVVSIISLDDISIQELGLEKLRDAVAAQIEGKKEDVTIVEVIGDRVVHIRIPEKAQRRLRKSRNELVIDGRHRVRVAECHTSIAHAQFRKALFGDVMKSVAQLSAENNGEVGCFCDEYGNLFFQATE